jgi:hypothetical protein
MGPSPGSHSSARSRRDAARVRSERRPLRARVIRASVDGATVVGHGGFYGVLMLYWPERRTVICGTINQSAGKPEQLLADVVRVLDAAR